MQRSIIAILFALLISTSASGGAAAHHVHGTPGASPMSEEMADLSTGAAYMTITNTGDEPDRLVGLETDAAETVEVHKVTMDDNVMEMTPLLHGLEIPAGETVSLDGDYHIMLIGLTE